MTIARIVLRRIARSRRTWALVLLPALAVLIASIAATQAVDPQRAYGNFVRGLLIPIVVALVALVIATSAIGDERDDLTILYLAQTPTAAARIVVETWISTVIATLVLVAPAFLATVWLAGTASVGGAALVDLLVAVALAACGYCALGVLLALLTRRAALVGLVYVLVWEGSLSGFAAGARNLSIAQHARSLVARSVDSVVEAAIRPPTTSAGVALIAIVAATAIGLVLASRRLQRMNLP